MRRRTRRVRLNPGPFVVLGLIVNLTAGAVFSPVTAVRRVRVEGAPPGDESRLAGILQALRGVPCARVDARAVETAALANSELRGAALSRTPFGSAVLRVSRRLPVGRLYARDSMGLDEDGVVYQATDLPKELPRISLPPESPEVGLTLGNGWPAQSVAHLATLVRDLGAHEPARIDVLAGGRVCLNIDSSTIDLGRALGLDEKVARLRELLRRQPALFVNFQGINLVDVDAPTFTPRKGVPPS